MTVDRCTSLGAGMALGQHLEERLVLDLGRGVPHRHVDRAHGDRAFVVAAGLFVAHQRGPDRVRVAVVALAVEQAGGRGFEHARNEALAHQRALAVAAVGVEAVADDGLVVAHDVGDDGHQAQRHLREVDVGVADVRLDGARRFADVEDLHGGHSGRF
jgi:hypothetical protein